MIDTAREFKDVSVYEQWSFSPETYIQRRKRSVSFDTGERRCTQEDVCIEACEKALLPDINDLHSASRIKIDCYDQLPANKSLLYPEKIERSNSDVSIDPHLSPSDNAIRLLTSVLSFDMESVIRTAIVYALDVLKSDPAISTVPVGLHPRKDKKCSDALEDNRGSVLNWLVSSYTPIPQLQIPRKRHSLKGIADGVLFAVSMRDIIVRTNSSSDMVPGAKTPGMRMEIMASMEGVNTWEWDIAGLHEASQHHPLQTLGWELLHRWELGEGSALLRTRDIRFCFSAFYVCLTTRAHQAFCSR